MKLFRATCDNHLFEALKVQWDAEAAGREDAPVDYYAVMMTHAERIVAESPPDPRYGIFVLAHEGENGVVAAPFEGIVHINHKLPNTSVTELRMVWHLIAPRYQFEEPVNIEQLATILSAFLTGGIQISVQHMPANRLRMYLPGSYDRVFARTVAAFLPQRVPTIEVAVKGNWLHISF